MQLLSVAVQMGNAEMYRKSGLVISRDQGRHYDAGLDVPVLPTYARWCTVVVLLHARCVCALQLQHLCAGASDWQ